MIILLPPNAVIRVGSGDRWLEGTGFHLSYRLYYHCRSWPNVRSDRSPSPAELADAIEHAASSAGTTVSGWLAETAAHRLRLEAGRRAIAEWEADNDPLTTEELADGLARARVLLGRSSPRRQARPSA